MPQAKSLDHDIGDKLRELRKERRLSLEKLGELLDVSGQQISRFEKGIHKLNASQLYVISRALNVPISWFFQNHKDSEMEQSHWRVIVPEFMQMGVRNVATDEELETMLLLKWKALAIQQKEALLSLLNVMK